MKGKFIALNCFFMCSYTHHNRPSDVELPTVCCNKTFTEWCTNSHLGNGYIKEHKESLFYIMKDNSQSGCRWKYSLQNIALENEFIYDVGDGSLEEANDYASWRLLNANLIHVMLNWDKWRCFERGN